MLRFMAHKKDMNLDQWIESTSEEILAGLLVDILLADGTTYSGYINTMVNLGNTESILLTSRTPTAGVFEGKKIKKSDIVGFNFSTSPRPNFGVHHIYITEKGDKFNFQHAVHDEQKLVLSNLEKSVDDFKVECMAYIKRLSREILPNEKLGLTLTKDLTVKYSLDITKIDRKIRDFLRV